MGLSLTEDIKSTGRPVVITVNGRPDIVLLDDAMRLISRGSA